MKGVRSDRPSPPTSDPLTHQQSQSQEDEWHNDSDDDIGRLGGGSARVLGQGKRVRKQILVIYAEVVVRDGGLGLIHGAGQFRSARCDSDSGTEQGKIS